MERLVSMGRSFLAMGQYHCEECSVSGQPQGPHPSTPPPLAPTDMGGMLRCTIVRSVVVHRSFGEHLVRFQTIMWRSKAMDEPEKREIEEELKVIYKIDQFIDGNPRV